MDTVLLLTRLVLAAVFIVSGVAKLADHPGARQAMLDFRVPARFATTAAILLPLVELVAAGSLILTITAWWGALGTLALLLLFTIMIGYNLVRGRTPKCHCFGQISSEPIGWPTIVRNLVLSALAGVILGFGRISAGASIIGWLGITTGIQRLELGISALVVALLVAIGLFLLRLLRQQAYLLRRFEELETRLVASRSRGKEEILPAISSDTPAPVFSLPDLSGQVITLDALRSRGKPVLLVFSDPDCGPCNTLLPELGRWQRDYVTRLTLALISRGTPEANRLKASQHGMTLLLLQQDREVAEAYGMQGTPCAVLVYSDGTMNRSSACGAEQIRELVAQAAGLPIIKSLPSASRGENGHPLPMAASHANSAPSAPSASLSGSQNRETKPVFTLPDLDGHMVSLADFQGKPTLLLFWNPGCGFCQQMLADLRHWEEEALPGAPELLVVSSGSVEANRSLALRSPVLHDEDSTVGPLFGVYGTPMALLVNADGTIASEVAAGAPAVLELARSNQTPVVQEATELG